jgi:NTP pyrophosphatase (non-canonical NTP hydrolase)
LEEVYKIPIMLALIHDEVSEALHAYRNWNEDEFKKELADIAIRLFDLAAYKKINLGDEIIEKHEFNKTRPYKHGNKRF